MLRERVIWSWFAKVSARIHRSSCQLLSRDDDSFYQLLLTIPCIRSGPLTQGPCTAWCSLMQLLMYPLILLLFPKILAHLSETSNLPAACVQVFPEFLPSSLFLACLNFSHCWSNLRISLTPLAHAIHACAGLWAYRQSFSPRRLSCLAVFCTQTRCRFNWVTTACCPTFLLLELPMNSFLQTRRATRCGHYLRIPTHDSCGQ